MKEFLLRNKIDFVQDQNDLLVSWHTKNLSFEFFISTAHWVSGIQNFQNNLQNINFDVISNKLHLKQSKLDSILYRIFCYVVFLQE